MQTKKRGLRALAFLIQGSNFQMIQAGRLAAIFLAFLIISFQGFAQVTTVTLGDGSGGAGSANVLFSTSAGTGNPYGKSGSLYTANEIVTAGGTAGNILKVRWSKQGTGEYPASDIVLKIYMKQVAVSDLSASDLNWNTEITGAQLVYSTTTQSFMTGNGWQEINLDTPFFWDGSSNLVVYTSFQRSTTTAVTTGGITWGYTVATNQNLVRVNSTELGSETLFLRSNRPDIQLDLQSTGACTSPPVAGAANSSTSNVCAGTSFTLNVVGASTGTGLTYQWQSSPNNSTWTNISGATSSFHTRSQLASTYYRVQVTCSGSTVPSTSVLVNSPALISGTFLIDKAGSGDFTTIQGAINSLVCGIDGPVIFNVKAASGTYSEQISIPAIFGASATNTITLNGNSNTIAFAATSTGQRSVVEFNGADYVTLNGFTINATGATQGWGISLLNNAVGNKITGNTINITSTSTTASNTAGIVASGSQTTVESDGNNVHDLTVFNNTINGGYFGISLFAQAATFSVGNKLQENTINNFYAIGINLENQDGILVSKNNIQRLTRTSTTTFYGIYVGTGGENMVIEKNKIHDLLTGTATTNSSTGYGIFFTAVDAPLGEENLVVNNLLYNFSRNGTQNAIHNASSDGAWYYHNTISFNSTASTGAQRGFYHTTASSNIQFKNNIISITAGASGLKHAIYFNTNATSVVSDYNNLYVTGGATGSGIGFSGTNQATLAAWTTATGDDANSVNANPNFVTTTGGDNLKPNNYAMNGSGLNLSTIVPPIVPKDYVDVNRTAFPDMGAYEFTPPASLDAAIGSIITPAIPVSTGLQPIKVSLRNNGGTTLTSVTIRFSINGVTTGSPYVYNQSLASGNSVDVTIANHNFPSGNTTLRVFTSAPNSGTDSDLTNDFKELTFLACSALSGTKTIGGSGADYATIGAAITDMSLCGIDGPVIFNIAPGTYNTEQIIIPEIPGASATNTVTFNGSLSGGVPASILAFASTTDMERAIIKLNGADHITIQNLAINATTGTYGYGIHLINGADNNHILNNTIDAGTNASTTNFAGIVASGTANSAITGALVTANNTTISGNTINGGYYGISMFGNGATSQASGQIIQNNTVKNSYNYMVYLNGQNDFVISGNEIHRMDRTASFSTFYGIYINVAGKNGLIEKNKVHDPFKNAPTTASALYGIYLSNDGAVAGQEVKVINNLLYNLNNNSTLYALYNNSSEYAEYYHNTVAINNTAHTATMRGFYQTGAATNIIFRNNNLSLITGSTGDKHVIYHATTTSGIVSNNNNLYISGGATSWIGSWGTADQVTLANWTSASGGDDANSVSGDPGFINTALDNYKPSSPVLNNIGANLGISTDILGVARSSNPDPGAYEFNATCTTVGTWTGGISTAWAIAGNWCGNVVPTATVDVVIPSGTPFSPVVTATANVNNLTINAGATLTLNNAQFNVYGTYTNNGTFNDVTPFTSATGDFVFRGTTAPHTIGGSGTTTIAKMTVLPSVNVQMAGPVAIRRVLILDNSLTTNGHTLTLLSNSEGTAMVYNRVATATVIGDVTMQRYVNPNPMFSLSGSTYRHYASPVEQTTLSDLGHSKFAPVVNPAYNTAAVPGLVRPFPNVFYFDETRLTPAVDTSAATIGYGYISPTSTSNVMVPGRGYSVYKDRSTVDLTGKLNNGDVVVGTLTHSGGMNAGWHLLGNPYPSPLDWKKVVADAAMPSEMDDAVYVFQADSRYYGTYRTYLQSAPLSTVPGYATLPNGIIPSMQGFFVHVNATTSTPFTFKNSHRELSVVSTSFYRTEADERPVLQLDLVNSAGFADALQVYVQEGATLNKDSKYDAYKLKSAEPATPNLYAITPAQEELAISGIPSLSEGAVIPLGAEVGQAGIYTFKTEHLLNIPTGVQVLLEDKQKGTVTALSKGSSLTVELKAGKNADRFALRLTPAGKAGVAKGLEQAAVYPNPTDNSKGFTLQLNGMKGKAVSIQLYNAIGKLVETRTVTPTNDLEAAVFSTKGLATGVYTIRLTDGNQTIAKKVVVQ